MFDKTKLRPQLIEQLQKGVYNVTFTKVDGEKRIMPCTLKPELLPDYVPSTLTKTVNESVLSVWCTDKQSWRSFRIENFIELTEIANEADI